MKDTTSEDAKAYMATRQIPQLFESMMTGLMYHRPMDHIGFLIECLQKLHEDGGLTVSWNSFVEVKKKDPLPPISTPSKVDDMRDGMESAAPAEMNRASPLPPIGRTSTSPVPSKEPSVVKEASTLSNFSLKAPVVLIMGGPGCGKSEQSGRIKQKYKKHNWCLISVRELLHENMESLGDAGKPIAENMEKGLPLVAPDEMIERLISKKLASCPDADGYLVEGFPITLEQLKAYNQKVGRADLVIQLDCDEPSCKERMAARGYTEEIISKNLTFFKNNTLAVIHHFDKLGKLVTLPGERTPEEIFVDISKIIDVAFYGKKPGYYIQRMMSEKAFRSVTNISTTLSDLSSDNAESLESPPPPDSPLSREGTVASERAESAKPSTDVGDDAMPKETNETEEVKPKPSAVTLIDIPTITLTTEDEGRKVGNDAIPIIFILGGPGSDKAAHCKKLIGRFPHMTHVSVAELIGLAIDNPKWHKVFEDLDKGELAPTELVVELVEAQIRLLTDTKAIVIEGFPRNQEQLESFNKMVGGLSLAVLLDCTEEYMLAEMAKRREANGSSSNSEESVARRMDIYKTQTLPVVKHIDGMKKLCVVRAERDMEEVHYDLTVIFNQILQETDTEAPNQPVTDERKKPEEGKQEVKEEEVKPEVAHTTGEAAVEDKPISEEDMAELKSKKVIFVVGGPGCGKGTQCAKIVEKYGYCHLSSGDLLRAEVASGSARAKELQATMESGGLVTLDTVLTLLKEEMVRQKDAKGFLIDGYPRELEQGTRFESEIVAPSTVLYFEVPDEVMVERLMERAKTSGRVDDNEETIRKRLKTFHDHCDAVLKHYEDKKLLCKMDARGTVDDIFAEVVKSIDATN